MDYIVHVIAKDRFNINISNVYWINYSGNMIEQVIVNRQKHVRFVMGNTT